MQLRRRQMLGALALPLPLALAGKAEAAGGVGWKRFTLDQGTAFAVRAPKRSGKKRPIVIYHHGAGGTAERNRKEPVERALIEQLARAGYIVMVSDFGGSLWGNDQNQRYIRDLIKLGREEGGREGKVALIGASMGGGAVLAWAGMNPRKTACVVGMIPLISMRNVDQLFLGGTVDDSYNGEYTDERYGAKHSPEIMAMTPSVVTPGDRATSRFSSVPTAIWYSTLDPICQPQFVQAFAARVRSRKASRLTLHPMIGSHTLDVFDQTQRSKIVAYVKASLPV